MNDQQTNQPAYLDLRSELNAARKEINMLCIDEHVPIRTAFLRLAAVVEKLGENLESLKMRSDSWQEFPGAPVPHEAAALWSGATPDKTTDTQFTQSFDARDWVRVFINTVKENPRLATDEGAMIAWFANLLMRGHDEAARKKPHCHTCGAAVDYLWCDQCVTEHEQKFARQCFGNFFTRGKWANEVMPVEEIEQAIQCISNHPDASWKQSGPPVASATLEDGAHIPLLGRVPTAPESKPVEKDKPTAENPFYRL